MSNGEKRDTIVLGASAGGIEALERLLPAFTQEVNATVFVVQHLPADSHSVLDLILARATSYPAEFGRDGEAIAPRRVYLAPPNRHLMIEGDRIRLWHGPRENHARPAVDALFRSAAVARGGRVMGAVLSGLLDDGAAGLVHIKRCGGLAFVQSPEEAIEPGMPQRALEALDGGLDGSLGAQALGARMADLVGTSAPVIAVPSDVRLEHEMALGQVDALQVLSSRGPPLPLSCPECGGPLWAVLEGRVQHYRCHTGHTYGLDSLISAQGQQIEQALWASIKGLEQRSQVLKNLAKDETVQRRAHAAAQFDAESRQLRGHAQTLRDVLIASLHEIRIKRANPPE